MKNKRKVPPIPTYKDSELCSFALRGKNNISSYMGLFSTESLLLQIQYLKTGSKSYFNSSVCRWLAGKNAQCWWVQEYSVESARN